MVHSQVRCRTCSRWPPFFRRTGKRPFNATWMNGQLVLFLYPQRQLRRRHGLRQGLELRDDLLRELVGMTRPSRLRQQSDNPSVFPSSLGGVKGGTRKRKQRGCMGDGIPINAHTSQEFLFDLHQVTRVKEGRAIGEERITHLIGMWMKGMRVTQGHEFFVRHT